MKDFEDILKEYKDKMPPEVNMELDQFGYNDLKSMNALDLMGKKIIYEFSET